MGDRIESSLMEVKARIALTGHPGVGKTTLIKRVLERVSLKVGGMLTEEIRKCGHRVGFSITDLETGATGTLAHLHLARGPQLGRYRVDLADLEGVGVAAIRRAIAECDLVVIDEIAPMELSSPAFLPAVEAALASTKALLISTHAHVDHPLVHRVRQELELIRVKLSNRDELPERIAKKLEGTS
jgi:nucleoside-triphosphatase